MAGRRRCIFSDGFHGLLFVAAWLALGWPVLTLVGEGLGLFIHLFLSASVVVLVLVCRAAGSGEKDR